METRKLAPTKAVATPPAAGSPRRRPHTNWTANPIRGSKMIR